MNLQEFRSAKRYIVAHGKNFDYVSETFNSGPFYDTDIGAVRVANTAVKKHNTGVCCVLEIDMMGSEPRIIHKSVRGRKNETTPNYGKISS